MPLRVSLVAADREVWSGDADMVIARTIEGDVGILPGHAPLLSVLAGGVVRVRPSGGGGEVVAAVDGGFLSVAENMVSVLAEQVSLPEEIDSAAVREELRIAEQQGDDRTIRSARARLLAAGG